MSTEVLMQLYSILGPNVPKCLECDGCEHEWYEALKLIKEALGDKIKEHRYHKHE